MKKRDIEEMLYYLEAMELYKRTNEIKDILETEELTHEEKVELLQELVTITKRVLEIEKALEDQEEEEEETEQDKQLH